MNYKTIYYHLIRKENEDALRDLMQNQEVMKDFEVERMEIHRQDGFPYILLYINADRIVAAQYIGLFLDITPLLPDYSEEWYYLPVVAICENYGEDINQFINKEISIQHELFHIADILTLIEQRPDYPRRVLMYAMNNIKDDTFLVESIDLEIFKIFYIEPRALTYDYNNGEHRVLSPLGRYIVYYDCSTCKEYIQMKLLEYLDFLEGFYIEKFSRKEFIRQEIQKAVNTYGREVFGETPHDTLNKVKRGYAEKILFAMLKRQFTIVNSDDPRL
jgi:hypothetical protein